MHAGQFSGKTLAGLRVLVVDDEPTLAQTFSMLLRMAGADAASVEQGALALALLRREHFDVVVCDKQMPVMTGPELIRTLRQDGNTVQVLLFVNSVNDEGVHLVQELRLAGTLSKPLAPSDLIAAVKRAAEAAPLH